jgi:hypothetical protein
MTAKTFPLTFTWAGGTRPVAPLLDRVDAAVGIDRLRDLVRDYTRGPGGDRTESNRELAALKLSALARQVFGPEVGQGRAAADVLVRLLAVSGRTPPLPGWR